MANTLDHSPAQITRQMLIDLGLGVAGSYAAGAYTGSPWPVFEASEPDSPDGVITVKDTTGRGLGRSQIDGALDQAFGVQVRVRSTTHSIGWLKADAIQKSLAEDVRLKQVIVEGVLYLVWCVHNIGQVLPIGTDVSKTKRKLFTLNVQLAIRKL